jgi:hypothetical protein
VKIPVKSLTATILDALLVLSAALVAWMVRIPGEEGGV